MARQTNIPGTVDHADAMREVAEQQVANLRAENEKLREASSALIAKIDQCIPQIDSAIYRAHGANYSGPHFGDELTAARAALAALEGV